MPLDVEAKLLSSHGHLAKKRVEMLRRKRARQVRENARRLEAWFKLADKENKGVLDKEQLRALLLHIDCAARQPKCKHTHAIMKAISCPISTAC